MYRLRQILRGSNLIGSYHSNQHQSRFFEIHLNCPQELCTQCPINAAVVGGKSNRHLLLNHHRVALHHGAALACTHRQNRGLRRINDGREILNAIIPILETEVEPPKYSSGFNLRTLALAA